MDNTRFEIEQEIKDEMRKKQREYKRQWRAKNADKIRKHNEDFIIRKAAKLLAEREQEGHHEQHN